MIKDIIIHRRKKLEARILNAIIEGIGENRPMPSLKEKDPRC